MTKKEALDLEIRCDQIAYDITHIYAEISDKGPRLAPCENHKSGCERFTRYKLCLVCRMIVPNNPKSKS
jgi:hypothetical protein